jgi:hypothetical protein
MDLRPCNFIGCYTQKMETAGSINQTMRLHIQKTGLDIRNEI